MNKRIVGIDLAVTATHKAIVFDTGKDEFVSHPMSFRATPAELNRLWKKVLKAAEAETEVVVILEATHMSWYPVGLYFYLKGAVVYRVNGQKTKDLRTVHHKHAGSDRIDCRVLVNLYRTLGDKLHRWHPETGSQLALQRACRRYVMWREMDVAHQNRLTALDQWAWGGLQKVVPSHARLWMRRCWYNPWHVAAAGVEHLTMAWHVAAPNKEDDWIERWVTRAHQRTQLYPSPQWAGFDHLQADVTLLQQERDFFVQKCADISRSSIQPLYRCTNVCIPMTRCHRLTGLVSIVPPSIMRSFTRLTVFPKSPASAAGRVLSLARTRVVTIKPKAAASRKLALHSFVQRFFSMPMLLVNGMSNWPTSTSVRWFTMANITHKLFALLPLISPIAFMSCLRSNVPSSFVTWTATPSLLKRHVSFV